MILNDDCFVRLIPLPPHVHGVVTPNDDGTFSIYINSCLDYHAQQKTYEHEFRHVALDHFYLEKSIEETEDEANA